jgi:hypothetical protein
MSMAALKKVEGLPDQNATMKAAGSLIVADNNTVTCSAAFNRATAQSICPSLEPTIPRGVAVTRDNWTSTMLPPNNLSYDRESPEPKTAFLFGLALGAVVPLLVLAVSA